MSRPFTLILTTLLPTTTRVLLSATSSATRKRWLPVSKPFTLILTTLVPTTTKAILSNAWEGNKMRSKHTKKPDNLVIVTRKQARKNHRIVAYYMHEGVYTPSRAR